MERSDSITLAEFGNSITDRLDHAGDVVALVHCRVICKPFWDFPIMWRSVVVAINMCSSDLCVPTSP